MVPAIICLSLAVIALVAARRVVASRHTETDRIEQLEDDRIADLKYDGPPRFNG
jgi:hypothetical protein